MIYRVALVALALTLGAPIALADEDEHGEGVKAQREAYTVRDRAGRSVGTVSRDPYRDGGYVVRDREGRYQGRLEPDPYGSGGLVRRDAKGRYLGTIRRDR